MNAVVSHRFSVEEFARLHDAGIFGEDDRVELLRGQIWHMAPIGHEHRDLVDKLAEWLTDRRRHRYRVGVQNPIRLDDQSEPLSDLVLYRQMYQGPHPQPSDIFLLIEVADTSLAYDSDVKLAAYAASEIREVWIVDLNRQETRVVRDPQIESQRYGAVDVIPWAEVVAPAAFPDLQVRFSVLAASRP